MGVRAIDVSRWQGAIDWPLVKADGVRAAWIKVGGADGGLYRDSRAAENLAGAQRAGLPFGTYYFCRASDGTAVAQARHAVDCGHGKGQLLPAADLETNPAGLSHDQLDRWLTEFCAEVRRLTGRESIWYGGNSTGVGYTTSAPRCPVWIANYGSSDRPGTTPPAFSPPVPPRYGGWDVWQFNSVTRVAGIAGNVDQDVITDAFWAAMTGAPTQQPAPDEEDDMREILWPSQAAPNSWLQRVAGLPPRPDPYAFVCIGAGQLKYLEDDHETAWQRWGIAAAGGAVENSPDDQKATRPMREHRDVPDVVLHGYTLVGPGGIAEPTG